MAALRRETQQWPDGEELLPAGEGLGGVDRPALRQRL